MATTEVKQKNELIKHAHVLSWTFNSWLQYIFPPCLEQGLVHINNNLSLKNVCSLLKNKQSL